MPASDDLRLLCKQERALLNSLENLKEFVHANRDRVDRRALDLRIAKLDEICDKFFNVRMKIELLTDDAAEDEISTDTEETEEVKLQRHIKIKNQRDRENAKILKEFENEVFHLKQLMFEQLQAGSSQESQRQRMAAAPAVPQSKVKLPELKLPTFSGKISDWVTFRDTYKNLIHNDASLSDMDKFTYLRTSLTGDALQEIASIDISSANYAIV